MSGRLQGKLALITGAAQGLGAATAHAFAREGARMLLTDLNEDGAHDTARAVNKTYGDGVALAARQDVASESDWIDVVGAARETLGGLSILVNNAGVVLTGTVEDFTLDEWRRGMAVNCDSVFLGTKHALKLMQVRQPGSIINISSIAGLIASHNFANYNASKAAVWMLTKSIALHCARKGWDIRCNSIHPAFVLTPILDDLASGKDRETIMAKLVRQVPLGRLGEAEDVAHAAVYLGSDESRFMTGAEMKLDGGVSAM